MGESEKVLYQYVIYDHPKDMPDKFVVRQWGIYPGHFRPLALIGTADTLDEARELVPPGLACLHRDASDDPVIVETWM